MAEIEPAVATEQEIIDQAAKVAAEANLLLKMARDAWRQSRRAWTELADAKDRIAVLATDLDLVTAARKADQEQAAAEHARLSALIDEGVEIGRKQQELIEEQGRKLREFEAKLPAIQAEVAALKAEQAERQRQTPPTPDVAPE